MGRRAAIGLMALGGATLALGLLWALTLKRLSNPTSEDLSPSRAGLALRSAGYGAVAEVAWLQRRQFPLITGAVGTYGPQAEVTVWVAGTLSGLLTRAMLNQIEEGIVQGNSPFNSIGTSALDGCGSCG